MTRRARAALAAWTIALGIVLVAGEAFVRVLDLGRVERAAEEPPTANRALAAALADLPTLVSARDISRPNVRGVHFGVLHRTNGRGVRGPEYSPEPAPGTYRVVLVGDSFAMGHRVAESDTYAALIDAERGPDFEVVNAALSGQAIGGAVRRLERVGLPYRPQLVVYAFAPNDIYGTHYEPNTTSDREVYRSERSRFDDSPLHLLRVGWRSAFALRGALAPAKGSHSFALRRAYFDSPQAWSAIERGLDRLAAISEREGICVHVFVQPVLQQLGWLHPYRSIYERVETAAIERGLTASVALPHFRGFAVDEMRFSASDKHPTPAGHRVLARALEAGLESLPEHCGLPVRSERPRGSDR